MKKYIWGTGRKCRNMIDAGALIIDDIVGFVETEKSADEFMGKKLYSLDEVLRINDFDYLFVTIKRNDSVYEICQLYNFPSLIIS